MSRFLALFVLALAGLPACGGATGDPAAAPQDSPAAAAPQSTPPADTSSSPSAAESPMAVAAIDAFIEQKKIDTSAPQWRTKLPKPPQVSFEPGKTYLWQLQTSEGPITMRLMPDVAPMHVSSTIYLTRLGFFDGLSFHRVIQGFMAQGGCPLGNGTGSPGYRFDGEFSKDVRHDRPGLLSMANAGPGTDGSQFFITFVPTPHLDGKHTIYGEVVEGMDTVAALEKAGSSGGRPQKPLSIEKATIEVQ